jgi:hypothetical protein
VAHRKKLLGTALRPNRRMIGFPLSGMRTGIHSPAANRPLARPQFLPGVAPYEGTLTVDFFPSGEWVRMVVALSPMHDEEFTRMASEGLASQFRNLDKLFQGRNQ